MIIVQILSSLAVSFFTDESHRNRLGSILFLHRFFIGYWIRNGAGCLSGSFVLRTTLLYIRKNIHKNRWSSGWDSIC